MPTTLTTQGATIRRLVHDPSRNRVLLISASGVDIYRVTDWIRLAWASLANVTCGAINDNGIYLGTSAAGVYRLPLSATGAATSQLISVFGTGAAVELSDNNVTDIAGHGTALAIVTASEFVYLPTPGASYDGPATATACTINGTYLAWADSDTVEILYALPTTDFIGSDVSTNDIATRLAFETGTHNLLICHAAGLRVVDCADMVAAPNEVTDEFTTLDNWAVSTQGASGSAAASGGEAVLTPVANTSNSVALRKTGDFYSAKINAKLASDGTNATRYLDVSIGTGTIVDNDDGLTTKWWHTALSDGYTMIASEEGSATGIKLYRHDGAGVTSVLLGACQSPTDWHTTYHDYELRIVNGYVQVLVDDSPLLSIEDSTYTTGDILIAQGEYSDGRGAIAHVERIVTTEASSGGDYGTNYGSDLGTVTGCQDAHKQGNYLAYGTSDAADGGRFGVLELSGTPSNKTTVSGDCQAAWIDPALTVAIHDNQLERYRLVAEISPAAGARDVRRDWTLYAEITDALGGIQSGTVALKVNGVSQTPSVAAITDGYSIAYTPGSNSGYGERMTIEISGTDAGGNTVSRSWVFTTASAPALTVTDAAPPNVVCIRDIGLAAAESDETVAGVNVVWIDTVTSPLIVTEAQAKEVGRVEIDQQTYHRHKIGVKVLATDSGELQTRDLRQGSIATITCDALGMTAQKCEILAAQRNIDDGKEDISYSLQAAYYEAVS